MRRPLLLFLPLVALSAFYFPGFCQSVPTTPDPPPSVVQMRFVFDQKDGRTKALQAVLARIPAPWLTMRPGSPSTGVWSVRIASSDAEWKAWRVSYDLAPDDPSGLSLCGETLYEYNLILIRNDDDTPGVFAHECCHALFRDHFTEADKGVFRAEWRREMRSGETASDYAQTNWEEGTAEAFRCYVCAGKKAPPGAIGLFRHFGGN